MDRTLTHLDNEIFTLSNVFTPEECRELIARAEAMGFESAPVNTPAGPQMLTNVRNNERVVFNDADLMRSLWERVREVVPQEMDGYPATGLNERLRFYRYDPGQRFRRHRDGRVKNAAGQVSRLSFLIYLSEGYEGGETVFRDYTDDDGEPVKHEITVSPSIGMGLFFVHERMHEGALILSGRKYVLRTDVVYAGAPAEKATQK